MSRDPVLPAVRAAVFAAVCLGLGAAAHRAMSDAPLPGWALAAGGAGAYLPARYAAARGERGLLGIGCLMAGLQVAFHVLFSYAQHGAGAGAGAAMPGMPMTAGMPMPAAPMSAAPMAATPLPGLSGGQPHMQAGAGMLLAHAVAAVACSWWLYRGEAAIHAVVRRAAFRLRRIRPATAMTVPPAARRRTARVVARSRVLRGQWLRGTLAQRGPPVAGVAG